MIIHRYLDIISAGLIPLQDGLDRPLFDRVIRGRFLGRLLVILYDDLDLVLLEVLQGRGVVQGRRRLLWRRGFFNRLRGWSLGVVLVEVGHLDHAEHTGLERAVLLHYFDYTLVHRGWWWLLVVLQAGVPLKYLEGFICIFNEKFSRTFKLQNLSRLNFEDEGLRHFETYADKTE